MFLPLVVIKNYTAEEHVLLTHPLAVFPTTMEDDEISSDVLECFYGDVPLVLQGVTRLNGVDFICNFIYTPHHIPWQIPIDG